MKALPCPAKLLTAALATAFASAAPAIDVYWVCGSGKWSDGCWSKSPGGPRGSPMPVNGRVFLTQSDVVSRLIDYETGGARVQLDLLTIDATGPGLMTLQQNRDALKSTSELIGKAGRGNFVQGGGIHTVGDLSLGSGTGSSGTYTLSGTGVLNTDQISVGVNGSGSFTQAGGTHTVGTRLVLAGKSGNGTYTLAGGLLKAADIDGWLGSHGSVFNLDGGTLDLTGGRIQVGRFVLASSAGTQASFELLSGKALNADSLVIGGKGSGRFTLNGGALNAASIVTGQGDSRFDYNGGTVAVNSGKFAVDSLNIGNGANLDLAGMNLVVRDLAVGNGALASQTGGSATVSGTLNLGGGPGVSVYSMGQGTLSVNNVMGSIPNSGVLYLLTSTLKLTGKSMQIAALNMVDSNFELGAGQTVNVNEFDLLGSSRFKQNGGAVSVGTLLLNTPGGALYTLNGGSLTVAEVNGSRDSSFALNGGTLTVLSRFAMPNLTVGDLAGSDATYKLTGSSQLSLKGLTLGNQGQGRVQQTGGQASILQLTLGSAKGGAGSYTLSGGTLTLGGALRGSGSGRFLFDGGTLVLTGRSYTLQDMGLADTVGSSAGLTIGSSQRLTNDSMTVGRQGFGTVDNAGVHVVNGTLSLGNALYSLDGGQLTVNEIRKSGQGPARFEYRGGSLNVNSGLMAVDELRVADGVTLQMSGLKLSTGSLVLGNGLTGASLLQSGGSTVVDGLLTLNATSPLDGYVLSAGSLSVDSVKSGNMSYGQLLVQNGTLNLTGNMLQVPHFSLKGTSFALAAGQGFDSVQVQVSEQGFIGQSGGVAREDTLLLGDNGSNGSWVQSGGTHTVDTISFGAAASGTNSYKLSGGTLNLRKIASPDGSGSSQFVHDGGVLNLGGPVKLASFVIGSAAGSNAALTLRGDTALDVDTLTLGNLGSATITQAAGAQRLGKLLIGVGAGSTGSYTLAGGSLDVASFAFGAGASTFNLDGGQLNADADLVGFNTFNIGNDTGSEATLVLGSGQAFGASSVTLGAGGVGHIVQGTGTATINRLNIASGSYALGSGTLVIGASFANAGSFELAGGTLGGSGSVSNTGLLQGNGAIDNMVNNSGLIEAQGGTLVFRFALGNANNGVLRVSSGNQISVDALDNRGRVNLSGGTLDARGGPLNSRGSITGWGHLAGGSLANAGSITFAGGSSIVDGAVGNTGQILVDHASVMFTGSVINDGSLKLSEGNVTFEGGFVGDSEFVSDSSTIHASDVEIGGNGYLAAGSRDIWLVSGRFSNRSRQATLWNTTAAMLRLSATGAQTMELAGADLGGANHAGYAANFAWGGLSLAAGNRLTLVDGNASPGAALYIGTLALDGGLAQLADITSPFNIYYDAHLVANAWLGGRNYELNGGGQLIAAVPEPATWLLALAGAALLAARRLRRAD